MSSSDATKVITPAAILSYPWIDEPQIGTDDNGKPNGKDMFSGVLVFVDAIMERYPQFGITLDALRAAAKVAGEAKFGSQYAALLRNPNFKPGFRTDVEEKGYPAGSTFINARNKSRPGLVYLYPDPRDGKPALVVPGLATAGYDLTDADKKGIKDVFYPGAIVRASVRAFGFETKGNRGVSFALNNLQLIDGTVPRLDNRKAAQDDFEADASAKPASLADLGVES